MLHDNTKKTAKKIKKKKAKARVPVRVVTQTPLTIQDVFNAVKPLGVTDGSILTAMLAVYVSTFLGKSDPLWLMVVGNPSSNKTTLVDLLKYLDDVYRLDTMTSNPFSSGQREKEKPKDLLPLIEGTTVNTKYGPIKTDHILFIASGAFQLAKPSDLLPELQGRLPIRVELDALKEEDFKRILKEPDNSLIKQYKELLKTENVDLEFTEDGIDMLAKISAEVNSSVENIGARRLHTIIEKVLDDISFNATDRAGETITVNQKYVQDNLGNLVKDTDLSKFIL